ncbi:MAG: hypothetical protein UT36_C0006G0042 [Candidatus Peregrinibacteria bacterium GW2011_GWF2_39_17]|nr:MAG: hypothetical protein UT36_C0006G0042 [Candidatus Peregrinibacteria bacterium GW2011_GWF2_39_17]HCW32796.1 hypothetical protein [Candidatus Peregrinibacteria bacterium]
MFTCQKSLLAIYFLPLLLGLILLFPTISFAQADADIPTPSNSNDNTIPFDAESLNDSGTFDVGDILSTSGQDQTYLNDEHNSPIVAFILDVINFVTRIIGAIAMIMLILGGLMMIVSEGDDTRLQKGKGLLETAIFGLIIVMFSYIIVRFVQSIFYLQ